MEVFVGMVTWVRGQVQELKSSFSSGIRIELDVGVKNNNICPGLKTHARASSLGSISPVFPLRIFTSTISRVTHGRGHTHVASGRATLPTTLLKTNMDPENHWCS